MLKDSDGTPEIILIATGSEVQLALQAADLLAAADAIHKRLQAARP